MIRHAPASTLFPYTTLFRSRRGRFRRAASLGPRGRRRRRPLLRGCRLLLYAGQAATREAAHARSEEHTSELQSPYDLVCRLLLEKKNHRNFTRRQVAIQNRV